jgi:hypothetical protein
MAFVRQKVSRGRSAFYLVENRRENGKVRQRVLTYLGACSTLEYAIAYFDEKASHENDCAGRFAAKAVEVKAEALRIEEMGMSSFSASPTRLSHPPGLYVPLPERAGGGDIGRGTADGNALIV